ncbi:hypothetical protein RRG08_005963 [Elysia crispata]|uniref:Uncharacterized protein n=1 Tax=Elysia crispata TaxID=231223 RepID=A0AAE1D2V7_9GAST|nr:hypothetical protein RRG08_005963 [Elysia crispata]
MSNSDLQPKSLYFQPIVGCYSKPSQRKECACGLVRTPGWNARAESRSSKRGRVSSVGFTEERMFTSELEALGY